MKIYVASSWKNEYQEDVVRQLRKDGHKVYDFKNPTPDDNGFSWKQVSEKETKDWDINDFKSALKHPIANTGFNNDEWAVQECDALILVLPCGRSAHLEAGYAAGKGKLVYAYIPEFDTPELMYKWFDAISGNLNQIRIWLTDHEGSEVVTVSYRDSASE